MNLQDKRILITGAGGGIGQAVCTQLVKHKARLGLLDMQQPVGSTLADALQETPTETISLQADITRAEDREQVVSTLIQRWGGIDLLINLAGVLDFTRFDEQDPGLLHRLLQVNVEAPLQLARAVLPSMLEQGQGRIVNVGSMFGSIGFPCFAAYSASKFALRGFSQALRRELAGTGVGVTYVSPRAVKTRFNPPVVHRMAEMGMMHMDEPDWVAQKIVNAIIKEKDEAYLGFPEGLFARLNGIFPGLVSRGIAKQVPTLLSLAKAKA